MSDQRDDLFQAIGVYAAYRANHRRGGGVLSPLSLAGLQSRGRLRLCVVGRFSTARLQQVVALAMFIPVVLNLAESVSSQSVSLTLHLLRGQRPSGRLLLHGWRQELAPSCFWAWPGAAVGVVALAWQRLPFLCFVRRGNRYRCGNVGAAGNDRPGHAAVGASRSKGWRPGQSRLAAADVITLFLYLGLARWLLG